MKLSPSAQQLLTQGLNALPFTLPDGADVRIARYLLLLQKWNHIHNLTAVRDPESQVRLHILDALAISPYVAGSALIVDVGSGAGIPGAILAMAHPDTQFYLIESNHKKVAFLQVVKQDLSLDNVHPVLARIEDWQSPNPPDWVISRALASCDDFIALSAHLSGKNTRWGLMKAHDNEVLTQKGFSKAQVHTLNVPLLDAPRVWIEIHKMEEE